VLTGRRRRPPARLEADRLKGHRAVDSFLPPEKAGVRTGHV
jgi:hypothetical protein